MVLTIGWIAGLLIGLSKTGIPGMGLVSVALMVYAFPGMEKQSTGAVLPLLILGDIFAVCFHTKDVQWKKLRMLFPPVLVGLLLGCCIMEYVNNAQFRILLGTLLLSLIALDQIRSLLKIESIPHSHSFTWTMGLLAGFTTLVGNAAGPVMSVYMIAQRLSKDRFMGTWVWFFFIVNLIKVPLMLGILFPNVNMITVETLKFDLMIIPALVLGAIIGRSVYSYIPEKQFVNLVLILNTLPAIEMVLSPFFK
ncbi:MAG: sulfite exporter TauE/SafE family protein [Thermoguttaceae bacterium]